MSNKHGQRLIIVVFSLNKFSIFEEEIYHTIQIYANSQEEMYLY